MFLTPFSNERGFSIMDLIIYTLADEELKRVESLIENNIPKIEALVPDYMKIYNGLHTPSEEEVPTKDTDLKSMYREAALKSHPDRGGDEGTFKELSSAYREGDKRKFMNAYNKAMGNQAEVIGELMSTNGYKWAIMYEEGRIDEVRQAFLKHLLNEIYMLETK
jgi:hypothetical protein